MRLSRFIVAMMIVAATVTLSPGQVYLGDKKGIVDPADLKKHDPAPRPIRIKEPPPPGR